VGKHEGGNRDLPGPSAGYRSQSPSSDGKPRSDEFEAAMIDDVEPPTANSKKRAETTGNNVAGVSEKICASRRA
jgi:hypothetical protein